MKKGFIIILIQLLALAVIAQPSAYQNKWDVAPKKIPFDSSIDAPLMGNGDVTMSLGFKVGALSYYFSKNDFWRLHSKFDGHSGPRIAGVLNIKLNGFENADFTAEQLLSNGITTTWLNNNNQKLEAKSWVSATDNLIFIELKAIGKSVKVSMGLTAPDYIMARLEGGKNGGVEWLTRSFVDSVDIATEVAIAVRSLTHAGEEMVIGSGESLVLALAVEGNFKSKSPLKHVLDKVKNIKEATKKALLQKHNAWWASYWDKSSIMVEDPVLMKAYYQGLYTMGACSRDIKFPPALFGWTTTDNPRWNGHYQTNYNFQAPFYGLVAANRLEQALPHDAPLLDFMPRGEWYAQNVTHTRGILYPVGIGPLGTEPTKDGNINRFSQFFMDADVEMGGLFFQQRSCAAYGLVNMAQYWRNTYDIAYGKKIYPYALGVVNFWEDYLRKENGRYAIYDDSILEGSGWDKNPILSLGMIRDALNLILELSSALNRDKDRQEKWQDILTNLSAFPVQKMNGKDVFRLTEEGLASCDVNGLAIQQIYPANGVTLDSDKELLRISRNTIAEIPRWDDNNTTNSFFMAAVRVGYEPEIVMDELRKYALRTNPNGFVLDNEHGIENSCTVQNALSEMLCMSVGNVLRLFTIPKEHNASFKNIRAWGAFLVSARLNQGLVSDVVVKSEKGKPVTLLNPWPNQQVLLIRNGKKAETLSGSRITFSTKPDETIELQSLTL